MTPLLPIWVAAAGSVGAVARFALDGAVRARFGRRFPLGTVTINVSGSLLLGFLTGMVLFHNGSSLWTSIAGVGFCGGFTTFSTASFETVRLIEERLYRSAVVNGGGTMVVAVGAGALGLVLGHM